jgi:hypothetical protein
MPVQMGDFYRRLEVSSSTDPFYGCCSDLLGEKQLAKFISFFGRRVRHLVGALAVGGQQQQRVSSVEFF